MIPSYTDFSPVQWILSISVAGTFFGHGLIACMGGEPKWFSYLQVAGIGRNIGSPLMRCIGVMDVVVGLCAIFYQWEGVLVWAALWGFATAVMRPLSGETPLAAVERTGNFLPAIALLYLNTTKDHTTYYWAMVGLTLVMLGIAVTLLLRQSQALADSPTTRKSK